MVLTQAAVEMLGEGVERVQIGYNPETRAIGLRAADNGTRGSYRLREQRNSVSRLVDGKRVFAHHGLTVDKARTFDAQDFGDGVVGFVLEDGDEASDDPVTGEAQPPRRRARPASGEPVAPTDNTRGRSEWAAFAALWPHLQPFATGDSPMPRNSYEINYARLEALMGRPLPSLEFETVYRLRAPGFMDLVTERLPDCEETGGLVLSLCHYFHAQWGPLPGPGDDGPALPAGVDCLPASCPVHGSGSGEAGGFGLPLCPFLASLSPGCTRSPGPTSVPYAGS